MSVAPLIARARWIVALAAICLALAAPATAWAAVQIDFYSREMGTSFPHAFVHVHGTLDSTGEPVDKAYGFTAVTLSPAILMGSVKGKIEHSTPSYIKGSDRQFSLTLTDDQFRGVLAVVGRWAARPQPNYNLNRRNCIHFVGEVAESVGLKVAYPKALMKKPRSFLIAVKEANPVLLAGPRAPAQTAR